MKLLNLAAIALIPALAVAQAPAQTVRVGTFHKASLVVAFYRSPLWAALAPAWPEIAKKARVAMIVADLPYADSSVQSIDVTEMLLDWLKADERTRTIVRGLK
jgi:hypothetical protein